MANNKVLVKDFVYKYNKAQVQANKTKLVKEILTRTYVSVIEKYQILEIMHNNSIVTQPNGIEYINTFTARMNFTSALLLLYTKLDHERDSNNVPKAHESYDMLKASGALDAILTEIGDSEINELVSVNDCITNNFYNQHTTEAFIAKQVDRLSLVLGAVIKSGIENLLESINNQTGNDTDKSEDNTPDTDTLGTEQNE
jgi:hypothetical protein